MSIGNEKPTILLPPLIYVYKGDGKILILAISYVEII